METASFTGLVKTLFWILVAYYAIKLFFKFFGPMIFQQVVKKAGENFQQQYQNQQQQQYQQQNYNAPKQDKPHETKKVGEYIDFEEIE